MSFGYVCQTQFFWGGKLRIVCMMVISCSASTQITAGRYLSPNSFVEACVVFQNRLHTEVNCLVMFASSSPNIAIPASG